MGAPKGTRPPAAGKGRKKGTPNKVTADLKAMIEGALQDAGGRAYLVAQAQENPAAFLTLVGKILPRDIKTELTGKDGGPLQVQAPKLEIVLCKPDAP
jgi:hypothetical protein